MPSESPFRTAFEEVLELRPWYTPVPIDLREVIVYRQPWQIPRQVPEEDEESARSVGMTFEDTSDIAQSVLVDGIESNYAENLDEPEDPYVSRDEQDPHALRADGDDLLRRLESVRTTYHPNRHAHPRQETFLEEHGYLAPWIDTTSYQNNTDTDLLRQRISNMTRRVQRVPRSGVRTGLPLLWSDDAVNVRAEIPDSPTAIHARFHQMSVTLCEKLDEMQMLLSSNRQANTRFIELMAEVSGLLRTYPHFLSMYEIPEEHELWATVQSMFSTFEMLQRRFDLLPPRHLERNHAALMHETRASNSPSERVLGVMPGSGLVVRREVSAEEIQQLHREHSVIPSARFVFSGRAEQRATEQRGAISEGVQGTQDSTSVVYHSLESIPEEPTSLRQRRRRHPARVRTHVPAQVPA